MNNSEYSLDSYEHSISCSQSYIEELRPKHFKPVEIDEKEILKCDPLQPVSNYDGKYFKVFRYEVRDPNTGELLNYQTEIRVINSRLRSFLNDYEDINGFEEPIFPSTSGSLTDEKGIDAIYYYLPSLLFSFMFSQPLVSERSVHFELMSWLKEEYPKFQSRSRYLISRGVITFETLPILFKKGKPIVTVLEGEKIGASFSSIVLKKLLDNPFYVVEATALKPHLDFFRNINIQISIPCFTGTKELHELYVQNMDPQSIEEFSNLGRKTIELSFGYHYKDYEGLLKDTKSLKRSFAKGRVVFDNTFFQTRTSENIKNYQLKKKRVEEDELYKLWPFITGFYLEKNSWCQFCVRNVKDIQFRERPFSDLQMSSRKKGVLELVTENQKDIWNSIHGGIDLGMRNNNKSRPQLGDHIFQKGSGMVVLLFGPPGCGKSFVGEVVAEHLQKPLISLSISDVLSDLLHINKLENKILDFLEMNHLWNGVCIIDDIDILLQPNEWEKTNNSEEGSFVDISRKSMTRVFLRILEQNNGFLILTTNRPQYLNDEALLSRISLILPLNDLTESKRLEIWRKFLERQQEIETPDTLWNNSLFPSTVSPLKKKEEEEEKENPLEVKNLNWYAKYPLNGRQIRNIILLSKMISSSNYQNPRIQHSVIMEMISYHKKFSFQLLSFNISKEIP